MRGSDNIERNMILKKQEKASQQDAGPEKEKEKSLIKKIKKGLRIKDKKSFYKKVIICFLGITGMGFFLSFLIMCGLGTDPYTFMNRSIAAKIGWSLGNWQLLLNAVMLIFVIVVRPKLIGLGTLFNMVLIGYYADFFCWLWERVLPESIFSGGASQIIIYAVCLVGFIISAAIYMNSDLGLSPYDGAGKIITEWLHMIPFFIVRICYDSMAIVVGMLVGGIPVIGIVLMAVGLGPAITIVGKFMKKHGI